ncbi:TetR/AcrR family transcriptional regulator [Candidatus Saccharibacteria bacterium]|nr:TetR/AcrR family transcriptional regulator [Candidatus Saccharibacteria bacterium]
MTVNTKLTILKISKELFAKNGYEGFSMRILAKESGVGLSSIYHFFSDKDEILKEVFDITNKELGIARVKLPKTNSAEAMLLDRIKFQFQHIEDVVFVLKYYLHFRPEFLKLESGYLPSKGYLHIEEVLEVGVKTHEFNIQPSEIYKEAKVIAHAINGFLLEYYPETPNKDELADVIASIHDFLMRSLTNKEVGMKR